jgi:hypothetical protein
MHHMSSSKRRPKPALAAVLLALLAGLVLAACGSSSTSSSSSTSTSAGAASKTTAATGKTPPGGASRFAALRECLKKNGVTLPKFTPGQRPNGTTHGALLPKGVSKSQYEAAVKKCGGRGGFFKGGTGRFNSPEVKKALAKFSSCMRENGVAIPKANTSGKGPIFSSKNLDTSSAKFKTAETKCAKDLGGAFHARPGAAAGGAPGGPGAAAGAPPAAG